MLASAQRLFLSTVLMLGFAGAPLRAAPVGPPPAEALVRSARQRLARGGVDERRLALRELEQATLLAPDRADWQLELGRAYYSCGFLKSAKTRFERVARLAPADAGSRFGLGQVWRRDWLKYLDSGSLKRAIENFGEAARREPARVDNWVMLSPLLVAQGNLPAATSASRRALEAAPSSPDAQLAAASTAWRGGDVERADSLFDLAVQRLPRNVRARFEDISPLASERDTTVLHHLPVMMQVDFLRRFWKEHDPDPATTVNEAQLEYWARCAQAYFLYYDSHRREWDERGELYVRYGPPERASYNPIGSPTVVRFGSYGMFPANVLVWEYPDLGMTVTLQDRLLSEYYLLPISMDHDVDPQPDPDSLARRTDALATRGGRGVFPKFPPGTHAVPVAGTLARFEGERGPHLLAQIETPGAPGDSLWAEWVVLDTLENEVARARRALSPSPCDATTRRGADFAADLPPGDYHVGVSVRGSGGARGVYREDVRVEPRSAALALSDVVISCGAPEVGAGSLQLAGNPSARVAAGDPLTAYFEIYHLAPDSDGLSHFEYVYTVRSTEKDPRIWLQRAFSPRPQVNPLTASREEQNPGSLRRQFVTVPIQSLPPGRYRLEIRVRDLADGTVVERRAPFERLGTPVAAAGSAPAGGR